MQKENRLVVADKGWAESAPEWLFDEIKMDRLTLGMSALIKGEKQEVGDAEVCLYLYTESLVQPMSNENTQIYLYLTTKLMRKRGIEVPEDIAVEKLNEEEEEYLKTLKNEIYKIRGGDIQCQLFDVLKEMKKSCENRGVDKKWNRK